jgi:hypothetical protein
MDTNSPSSMDWKVPRAMIPFVAKCPPLLPGETERDYHALFVLIVEEIEPQTSSEYLVTAEIVGLFWEIARFGFWKNAILKLHRRDALENALRATYRDDKLASDASTLTAKVLKDLEDWQYGDQKKRFLLDDRLDMFGYDEQTINAEALLHAAEPLSIIERFQSSARGQLNAMLKGVHVRREFVARANKAFNERLKLASEATMPKQIGPN